MKEHVIYTSVGHLDKKRDVNGVWYPVVVANQEDHLLDHQEMTVWSLLSWQLMNMEKLERAYDKLMASQPAPKKSLGFCIERLQSRGLIAAGSGNTVHDALYDLMSGLYIVPVDIRFPRRIIAFFKLVAYNRVSLKQAGRMLRRDSRSELEQEVLALCRRYLLSTSELIKCMEWEIDDISTEDKLLDALYIDSDTTSDSLPYEMMNSEYKLPVTLAVSNLYLRKQIILDMV